VSEEGLVARQTLLLPGLDGPHRSGATAIRRSCAALCVCERDGVAELAVGQDEIVDLDSNGIFEPRTATKIRVERCSQHVLGADERLAQSFGRPRHHRVVLLLEQHRGVLLEHGAQFGEAGGQLRRAHHLVAVRMAQRARLV
jgi:hypothetical protein